MTRHTIESDDESSEESQDAISGERDAGLKTDDDLLGLAAKLTDDEIQALVNEHQEAINSIREMYKNPNEV